MDLDELIEKDGTGICTGTYEPCDKLGKWRRQNTRYANDELNWVMMCDTCAEENSKYWHEMWIDYYSMVMGESY